MNDTSMIVRNSIDFVLLLVYIMRNKYLRSLYMKNKTHKWSAKYKKSIDCKNPRGFSQKQHCKYGRNRGTVKNKKPIRYKL